MGGMLEEEEGKRQRGKGDHTEGTEGTEEKRNGLWVTGRLHEELILSLLY